VLQEPEGIDPAWNCNPGKNRQQNLDRALAGKLKAMPADLAEVAIRDMKVRKDIGVPRWLDTASQANAYAIGLLEAEAEADSMHNRFDLALLTPAQQRPDPCADFTKSPSQTSQ